MRFPYHYLLAPKHAISWPARCGVALVSSGLILLVCLFLDRFFTGAVPLTLFTLSVAVSAWYGGLWAGLLAALFSAMASDYFLLGPRYEFSFHLNVANGERLTLL